MTIHARAARPPDWPKDRLRRYAAVGGRCGEGLLSTQTCRSQRWSGSARLGGQLRFNRETAGSKRKFGRISSTRGANSLQAIWTVACKRPDYPWEGALSAARVARGHGATLAADVVGYSRPLGRDEAGMLAYESAPPRFGRSQDHGTRGPYRRHQEGRKAERVVCRASQPVDASTRVISTVDPGRA